MEVSPKNHPVSQLEFDVIIGADGRRNTLPGTITLTGIKKSSHVQQDHQVHQHSQVQQHCQAHQNHQVQQLRFF